MAVVAGGCSSPRATVELFHPFEIGLQESVELDSEWAHYDSGDAVAQLLCEWPLPGSRYGKKQYELYLRLPTAPGVFKIGTPIELISGDAIAKDSSSAVEGSGPDVVSGFLIQKTGRLRGVTHVATGQIEIKRGNTLRGSIDLVCADETEIVGEFVAKPGYVMSFFEREHQLDIANARIVAQGEPLPKPPVTQE